MSFRSAFLAGLSITALLPAACEPVAMAPERSYPINAPSVYRQWYQEAEECRGLDGYYSLVRFYVVPHAGNQRELGIRGAIGRWAPPHRIYLLEGHVLDEATIKHEMLHDILSFVGDYTHNDSLAFRVCDLTDEGAYREGRR